MTPARGRPIEYDLDEVLDQAVRVFWERGWRATSVRDVVDATGLNTKSMYALFGDKHGLFRAALERYAATVLEPVIEQIRAGHGIAAIERYLMGTTTLECNGCLFVNTLSENDAVEPEAVAIVKQTFKAMRETFRDKLAEDEAFCGNASAGADYLMLVVNGLSVCIKHEPSVRARRRAVRFALKALATTH